MVAEIERVRKVNEGKERKSCNGEKESYLYSVAIPSGSMYSVLKVGDPLRGSRGRT